MLNKGFSRRGIPWDSQPLRKYLLLWACPFFGLVIAVSGGFIIHQRLAEDYSTGYVVSNDADCTLVVADRPDGPPVETVEQNSGGRLGTCGGLDKNQEVYYDPGEGIQVFGDEDTKLGFVVFPLFALAGLGPGALAWIDTYQKRRARKGSTGAGI